MTKGIYYHTNSVDYPPKHRNVHHDHANCLDGKRIELKHREGGTGGKPLCKACEKLG